MVRATCLALSFAVTAALAAPSLSFAASMGDNPVSVSGIAGIDYYVWQQVGVSLIRNEAVPLSPILQGNLASPGGNVELFANSELPGPGFETYRDLSNPGIFAAFLIQPRTTVAGTLNGAPISIRSLNGEDWFTPFGGGAPTPAYGANNLANKWLSDFFGFYNLNTILAGAGFTPTDIANARLGLFAQFLTNNGFPRLSDPNISYVNQAAPGAGIEIGLAGGDNFLTPAIQALLAGPLGRPDLVSIVPPNMQASELVRVEFNGLPPQYLYSFTSVPSGLSTTDGTESYNTTFQVTAAAVPEPASLGVLALGGLALLARRRR